MECWYIPVLLWKRVLVSLGHILKTTRARHLNVIPFDWKYTILSDNIISTSKFKGL